MRPTTAPFPDRARTGAPGAHSGTSGYPGNPAGRDVRASRPRGRDVELPLAPRMYCPHCQGERRPRMQSRGSPLTTLVLLLVFFPAALVYEAWRRAGKYVCPACGKGRMVRAPAAAGPAQADAPPPQNRKVRTVLRAREREVAEVGEAVRLRLPEFPETVGQLPDPDDPSERFAVGSDPVRLEVPEAVSGDALVDAVDVVNPVVDAVRLLSAPGAQTTSRDTPLVFSASTGNAITVGDAAGHGAASSPVHVAIRARRGSVRLSRASGLSFSLGNGRDNFVVHFSGPPGAVNAALEGMSFTPSGGFTGNASLWVGITESEGRADRPADAEADVVIAVGEAIRR